MLRFLSQYSSAGKEAGEEEESGMWREVSKKKGCAVSNKFALKVGDQWMTRGSFIVRGEIAGPHLHFEGSAIIMNFGHVNPSTQQPKPNSC